MSEITGITSAVCGWLAGMLLGVLFFRRALVDRPENVVFHSGGALVFRQLSGQNRGRTGRILLCCAG
jgi:hypothetical protein